MKRFCLGTIAFACLQAHAQTAVTTLPAVGVTGAREPHFSTASSTVLREGVDLRLVPQSVIVINRRQMDEQDARTVQEAVRSVSNVRAPDLRDQFNTQYKIRGFNAATMIDGLAMPSTFSNLETTAAVERIEVIKGPASSLASAGQSAGALGFVGGALAVTTRSPEAQPLRSVGIRLGSRAERGLSMDLNQPVNDVVALRLIAETHRSNTESDGVFLRRTSVFPSLSIRPAPDRELLIKLRASRQTTLDYSGLPPEGTIAPAAWVTPRSLNVTAAGQPDTTAASDSLTVQWKQSLGTDWQWDVTLAHLRSDLDQNGVFTDDFFGPNPGPVYLLAGVNLTQNVKTSGISSTLRGRVNAAGMTHHLVFGLDLDRTTDFGYMAFAGGPPGVLGIWDMRTPVAPAWVAPVVNLAGAQDNRYRSTALYLQDRVAVTGALNVTLGLRHTRIRVDNQWPSFGVASNTSHSHTSPRVGATLDLGGGISAFAGHGRSMSVPTNGIYTTPPKPEQARQTEVGLRLSGVSGLDATLAWFDLARRNVPVADPANFGQSIQVGEQRSSGIDIDANWRISPAWTVQGNWTRQNPRVSRDTTLAVGNQLFNTYKQSARLAVRHEMRSGPAAGVGLGLGLGVSHHSPMPVNAANTLFTPAVTVWDAQASYSRGPARYQVGISNLFDRRYFEPAAYFNGPHVIPGTRRQISASAQFSF